MHRISLKWKISLGLSLLATFFVGIYLSSTYISLGDEKAAFMAEAQRKEVGQLARMFMERVDEVRSTTLTILSGYDFKTHRLNPIMNQIFVTDRSLLSVEVFLPKEQFAIISLEKPLTIKSPLLDRVLPRNGRPNLIYLGNDRFVLAFVYEEKLVRLSFAHPGLLNDNLRAQSVALIGQGRVLKHKAGADGVSTGSPSWLKNVGPRTDRVVHLGRAYLVSSASLPFTDFHFVSLIQEHHGFSLMIARTSVLLVLFFFSVLMICTMAFRGFDLTVASMVSATRARVRGESLTSIIETVQRAVTRTSQAHAQEFSDWMSETSLPPKASYANGRVRLSGAHSTGPEYSGDWWFYYQRGYELHVFIAEFSGTSAQAAMTAAATRSLFAKTKDSDMSLREIAEDWDKVVHEISRGKAIARASMFKVHVEFGEVNFLNAGHDPAVLLRRAGRSFKATPLIGERNFALGERRGLWLEDIFELQPDDHLVLFAKTLTGSVPLRDLESALSSGVRPSEFVSYVRSAGAMAPTMVALDFKAGRGGG